MLLAWQNTPTAAYSRFGMYNGRSISADHWPPLLCFDQRPLHEHGNVFIAASI